MIDSFIPISTKIRPIRKVYILDDKDINSFIEILKFSTTEIDGTFNLIFTYEQLQDDRIKDLINIYYPDVIINYSKEDNKNLRYFNKYVINNKGRLHFLKTDISYWNRKPNDYLSSLIDFDNSSILYNSTDEISNEYISKILEYGIVSKEKEFFEMFENSIFRNFNLIDIGLDQYVEPDNSTSIIDLSDYFSSSSYTMSSKSNPNRYFSSEKERVLIIGSSENLHSLLYFWNERALYFSKTIKFITEKELDNCTQYPGFKYYVNFTAIQDIHITDENDRIIQEIDYKYYFDGKINRWENFWHYSYAKIEDGYIEINQPVDKSFSIFGVQNVMMDIGGINECFLPINHEYSDLFVKGIMKNGDYRFTSNSDTVISVYEHIFNLDLSYSDIYSRIYLPNSQDILHQFEKIHNIRLEETKKTILFNNLHNSIKNSLVNKIIRSKSYFDLIVSMAPKRMSKILSDIHSIDPEINVENIGEYLNGVVTLKSDIICSLPDLKSRFSGDRSKLLENIELLIHENILLQGKKFYCPICNSELWFLIDDLKRQLNCCYCNNMINLPITHKGSIIQESVRLNELFIESIDQGQFSMLLINEIIKKQNLRNKNIYYNLNIYKKNDLITDIDILLIMNNLIGFFEVKSNRNFNIKQAKSLIEISEELQIDFIVFSSLLTRDCNDTSDFINELKSIDTNLSIIVITAEILFSDKIIQFKKYLNKGVVLV